MTGARSPLSSRQPSAAALAQAARLREPHRGGTLGDGTALADDDDGAEPKLRTTIFLLAQIRAGNQAARTKLWNRYLRPLGRLVRGHYIPHRVRALHDVDDIVMRVIEQVDPKLLDFEYRREGALMDYLRTVTRNLIISLSRVREPEREEMPTNIATDEPTPHERAVAMDQREAFEAALGILDERQRQAVILRFEYGFKYEEIAEEVDLPSGNAARMMIQRAMLKMVEHMRGHRDFD